MLEVTGFSLFCPGELVIPILLSAGWGLIGPSFYLFLMMGLTALSVAATYMLWLTVLRLGHSREGYMVSQSRPPPPLPDTELVVVELVSPSGGLSLSV
jgi:hypothetical protein